MKNNSLEIKCLVMKFGLKGDKSGWTYINIDPISVQQLNPGNKQSFRVKGEINSTKIKQIALIPIGDGSFIMPLNSKLRKSAQIFLGETIDVKLSVDKSEIKLNEDFISCLQDDEIALSTFNKLTQSHKNYFSKWIGEAKTENTKTKRIVLAVNALSQGMNFAEMLHANKKHVT